jgi:Hemerythrin HHE cation binding domain
MTATRQQDAVDVLLAQHERIKGLFGEVLAAQGEEKRERFEDLVRMLAVHEAAEEQLVHPLARRNDAAGDAVVAARLGEERQARRDLADLYELGTAAADFDVRLTRLRDAVLVHAAHEEQEEFPLLRRSVTGARLAKLGGSVLRAERLAPTRPHPHAPSSGAGNLIVGPPTAVFDRVRDAVRDAREDRPG